MVTVPWMMAPFSRSSPAFGAIELHLVETLHVFWACATVANGLGDVVMEAPCATGRALRLRTAFSAAAWCAALLPPMSLRPIEPVARRPHAVFAARNALARLPEHASKRRAS